MSTINDTNEILVLTCSAQDQAELFTRVSREFTGLGLVRPSFGQALAEREARYPTGLDFGEFTVAVPHADPEHVLVSGMAVVRLDHEIDFRAMDDPDRTLSTRLTIWPLVIDPSIQVDILSALLACLQDEGNYARLLTESVASVNALLKHYLPHEEVQSCY